MSNDEAETRRARLIELSEGSEPRTAEIETGEDATDGLARLRRAFAERRKAKGAGGGRGGRGPLGAARRLGAERAEGGALERFPRLQQLLAERQEEASGGGEVTAANSPEEIARYQEGLESLIEWLEQTLESTRQQLAEVRRWQSGGPDADS